MELLGHIQNGVVVLAGGSALPEGAVVTVTYRGSPTKDATERRTRIQVPIVHTGRPGTILLTNERIAEILDDEDANP